jgi:DNA modification methylase
MGSGTTALAAEILNREWIGAEISSQYCKMAQKRVVTHFQCNSANKIKPRDFNLGG